MMKRAFSRNLAHLLRSLPDNWSGGLCAVFIGFALAGLGANAIAQQAQVGVSAAVRGSVEVVSGAQARTPRGGEAMLLGDRVRTQSQSGMQVLLLDESVFTVGESNDLIIDRFVYDPDRGLGEIAARSTQGFLRFVSGGVGAIAPQNMSLTTPSATIGSRGTTFDVVVGPQAVALAQAAGLIPPGTLIDPATAVFVILRGPASIYNGITQRGRVIVETAGGSVEIRREGYGVFVPAAGAAPIGPVAVPGSVDSLVVAAIEVPTAGGLRSLDGVDLIQLPNIAATPDGILLPGPGEINPDVTGPGFNPCHKSKRPSFAKQTSTYGPCNL